MKKSLLIATLVVLALVAQAQCVQPFPSSENFEGAGFVRPSNSLSTGSLPSCWSRSNVGTDIWLVGAPYTSIPLTGPSGDHTSGTGKYLCRDVVGNTFPVNSADITSPYYSLVGSSNPIFSFWYHIYGNDIGILKVEINNGSGWTSLLTKNQTQTSSSAPWLKEEISLSSYVGDTVQFRFTGTRSVGFPSECRIALDDFEIKEAPSCAEPVNFYLTGNTATSTSVGWTNVAGNTYLIEYGLYGFTPGTGTTVVATNNPQLVTGLNGSTTYEFYLRTICPVNDTSAYVGPNITTTNCTGPLVAPFVENFDSPKWVPYQGFSSPGNMAPCWARNINVNDYNWRVNPNSLNTFNTGPSADHTTGNGQYIGLQRVNGGNDVATLRSPSIDLSSVSYPELSFWYHMYGNQIDKLEVQVKTLTGGAFTTVLTLTGQQQTSSSDSWKKKTISLNAYTNDVIYIRLRATATTTFANSAKISIDDLSIQQGSSCPAPSNLLSTQISPTTVDLSWLGTGNFEIKYGAIGFDQNTTGTSVSATGNSHTLTGLTPGSDLEIYIRKICTSTDTSSWEGPIQVHTDCFVSAPYSQNFDGTSWVPGVNFNDDGLIDDCWTRDYSQYYNWVSGPSTIPSFQTGPQNDHTSGSGKFLYAKRQTSGGGTTAVVYAKIKTEFIDLTALTVPELSVWYHMYGNQIGTFDIDVNNGSGWTNVFSKVGQQQTSKTANWDEAIIDLSAYANDTIQVRFSGNKSGNAFNSEIAIDDLDIHEQPSCPKPSNLTISAVTFNAGTLAWTTGGATNWIIKQQVVGAATATFIPTNTNPHNLTGLLPATSYDFWVKDSCGSGDASQWFGPIRVRTFCSPTAAPFTENFDGTNFTVWSAFDQDGTIDNCFVRTDTIDYYWVPGPGQFSSFQTGPDLDASGTGHFLYTRSNNFQSPLLTTIVIPWVDISSLSAPELRFKYHMYGSDIDKMQVRVNGADGSSSLLKTIMGQQQTSSTASWLDETISLAGLTSDTIRIQFIGYRNINGFKAEIAIDEIEIDDPKNCSSPTLLATANPTSTTIDVSWTSDAGAAGSNIEYGLYGFTPGTGIIIHNVTSPYTVVNLQSGTAYDFYVQDSCAWGGLSAAIGPETDTTLPCTLVVAAGTMSSSTGLQANFDASTSTGTIDTYNWDFGDGNTATGATASNNYVAGGVYTITLIVSNGCGNSDTTTFTVSICDVAVAQFSPTITALTVAFDGAASTGTTLNYDWLYGDGNTGTGANSSHTYAADGVYNVSLIVTDACGNVDTVTQTITVCGPLSPTISYTQNGLIVTFDGTIITGATDWQWDFGDGNTASGDSVSNTYSATGTYQISLTVTNLCGDVETVTIVIDLCNPPKASWTYTILSSGGGGMTVQFDGTASIGANSYIWDFGDGTTNTVSAVPSHTYGVPGLFYIVSLTVINDCGDENNLTSSLAAIGIEDFEKAGMTVFPNPVDDYLMLQIPEFITINTLQISSVDGKVVSAPIAENEQNIKINTTNLAAGTYFLHVNTNAGNAVYQLVVKH